jgi:hypothetical protein
MEVVPIQHDRAAGHAGAAAVFTRVNPTLLTGNVYTEFRLDYPLNAQNPRSEGWIAAFRS